MFITSVNRILTVPIQLNRQSYNSEKKIYVPAAIEYYQYVVVITSLEVSITDPYQYVSSIVEKGDFSVARIYTLGTHLIGRRQD